MFEKLRGISVMNSVIDLKNLKNDNTVLSILDASAKPYGSFGVKGEALLAANLFDIDMSFDSEELAETYESFSYWIRPVLFAALLMSVTIMAVLLTGPLVHP